MKSFKKKIKRMRGITLVGLVITIILLLILAGVAINLAIGEKGIFNQSKLAAEKYKDAQNYEEEQLQIAANAMLGNISGNRDENGNEYVLKSQYDALLARVAALEQNSNSQSGTSSISNNYSTDEQVVGTWTDGKKIYQITYNLTSSSTSGQEYHLQDVSNLKIDNLVDIKAISKWTNGAATNHQYMTAEDYFNVWYNSSTDYIDAKHGGSHFSSKPVSITLQYTKKSTTE